MILCGWKCGWKGCATKIPLKFTLVFLRVSLSYLILFCLPNSARRCPEQAAGGELSPTPNVLFPWTLPFATSTAEQESLCPPH